MGDELKPGVERYNKFKGAYDEGARRPLAPGGFPEKESAKNVSNTKQEIIEASKPNTEPPATKEELLMMEQEMERNPPQEGYEDGDEDFPLVPKQSSSPAQTELRRTIASNSDDYETILSRLKPAVKKEDDPARKMKVEQYGKILEGASKPQTTPKQPTTSGNKQTTSMKEAIDTVKDEVGFQAVGGIASFLQATGNLMLETKAAVQGLHLDKNAKFNFADEYFPESEIFGNRVVRGATQFLAPFGTIVATVPAAGTVAGSVAAGAIVDFVGREGDDKRVADFLAEFPALNPIVPEFLKSHPGDSAIEGRTKNAIEGIFAGVGAYALGKAVFGGMKLLRNKFVIQDVEQSVAHARDVTPLDIDPKAVPEAAPNPDAPLSAAPEVERTIGDITQPMTTAKTSSIDDLFRPTNTSTKGGGTELNLTRIEADEETLSLLKNTGADSEKELLDILGDPQKLADVKARASKSLITRDELLGKKVSELYNDEEITVLRDLVVTEAEAVRELARQYRETNNPELKAKALAKHSQFLQTYAAAAFGKARLSQTFNALKINAKGMDQAKALAASTEFMDPVRSEQMIDQILTLDDKAMVDVAKRSKYRNIFDAVQEVYVNNLLLRPATQMLNIVSSPIMLAQSVVRRGMAPVFSGAKPAVDKQLVRDLLVERQAIMDKRANSSTPFDVVVANDERLKTVNRQLKQAMDTGIEPGEASVMAGAMLDAFMDTMRLFRHPAPVKAINEKGLAISGTHTSGLYENAITSKRFPTPWKTTDNAIDMFGAVQRTASTAMNVADDFWKIVGFKAEQKAVAYRLGRKAGLSGIDLDKFIENTIATDTLPNGQSLTSLINPEAREFAKYNTFTNDLGPIGDYIHKAINTDRFGAPHLKLAFPFFKIPLNVTARALDNTPFIGLERLSGKYNQILLEGGPRAQELNAQTAMGYTFFATMMTLGGLGLIKGGGPKDPRANKEWQGLGNVPYSIRIGEHDVPLNNIGGHLGKALAIAVDAGEVVAGVMDDDPNKEKLISNVSDMMALLTMSTIEKQTSEGFALSAGLLFDSIKTGDPDLLKRIAANSMPLGGWSRELRNVVDPFKRQTTDTGEEMSGFVEWTNYLKNQVPGLSATLPLHKDLFDNPQQLPSPYRGGVLPVLFGFRPAKEKALFNEFERLGYLKDPSDEPPEGETYLRITRPSKTIGDFGATYKLDPYQYDQLVTFAAGKGLGENIPTLEQKLTELVKSPEYRNKNTSDEKRRLMIVKNVNVYRQIAVAKLKQLYPEINQVLAKKSQQHGKALKKGSAIGEER